LTSEDAAPTAAILSADDNIAWPPSCIYGMSADDRAWEPLWLVTRTGNMVTKVWRGGGFFTGTKSFINEFSFSSAWILRHKKPIVYPLYSSIFFPQLKIRTQVRTWQNSNFPPGFINTNLMSEFIFTVQLLQQFKSYRF
jgi:hypothetical protein